MENVVYSIEDGGERAPLQVFYDHARDVVIVEGMEFSGDLFRTWRMPTDKIYKFARNGSGAVVVEQVVPCEVCAQKFRLYKPKEEIESAKQG